MTPARPGEAEQAAAASSYPIVRRPRPLLSTQAIIITAVLFGLLIFGVLEARRRSPSAPATTALEASVVRPLPPLALPLPLPEPSQAYPDYPRVTAPVPLPVPGSSPVSVRPILPPTGAPYASSYPPLISQPGVAPVSQPRTSAGPAVVYDSGATAASDASSQRASDDPTAASSGSDRVRAGAFLNRSTTVAQGTIIPAVLETAFDSTGPGFARALVQRDVRGFDGTRVLVPRGSRLLGRYRSVPAAGQKRVLISWFRLIRPDGVTIDLDSPASDILGRGGVKADVDTHFFERFSAAILQSALDVGVGLATRNTDRSLVVALPGSVGTTGSALAPQTSIPPTLRVRAGTSVSVFVARDLDFTAQE